jgi:arylsulfatase A-like enzyme
MVRTPNIDALAVDGTLFENAFTPTAICTPARASLLTGLYAHKHHMVNNSTPGYSYNHHMRPDMRMLQDWMADSTRYESAYFGKWHVGPADDLFASRFDRTHDRPYPGGPPFLDSSHWHPNTRLGPLVQSVGGGEAGTLDVPMEGFPDVAAGRYAQRFMRERSDERPFTLFCALPGPHSPWMVPEEFGIRYDPRDIPDWPNRYDDFHGKPINQKKLRLMEDGDEIARGSGLQDLLACAFSYLELVDTVVGEVVSTLRELGLYDDTAVFLTADHGDMAGSHGFRSKGAYMYDEIYRIPMLFKPPGGSAVRRVRNPVNLMDATATMTHLIAGEQVRDIGFGELDGRSMLPLTEGAADWYKSVNYSEYHGDWFGHYSSRMVTDGRWKLVWNLSDLGELYDLEDDPHELKNLFYEPAVRKVRESYFEVLREEAKRFGDGQLALLDPEYVEHRLGENLTGPLPISR